MKRLVIIWKLLVTGVVSFLIITNFWVINSTSDQVYEDVELVPSSDIALVLGTSKYKTGGGNNLFFDNRIKAAAELFKAGKVKQVVLSGTKDPKYYDEPKDMKAALMDYGVPEAMIVLDGRGFRTMNSIENVPGDKSMTIITQRYHAYRALFLSESMGVEAICYEAEFPSDDYSYTTVIREVFARPKALLDLYVLD
ncbi:MAG: YdcF family protein [Cyclobacteriaceae bacterium]